MHIRHTCRATIATIALSAAGFGALALAQSVTGGFEGFWGTRYAPLTTIATQSPATGLAEAERRAPFDARSRLVHWNGIAIDASGLDHTPVAPGEDRIFGEQLGPGRASRAMAIVHIAIFDAVNAIDGGYRSYTGLRPAPPGASVDAAIAQAAHDTLVALFPSQAASVRRRISTEDLATHPATAARTRDASRPARGGRDPRAARRRRLAAHRAARRHRLHPERRAGQLAPGSDQPDPARARRALGRGQAVRARVGRPVPRAAAAGADEPRVRRPRSTR